MKLKKRIKKLEKRQKKLRRGIILSVCVIISFLTGCVATKTYEHYHGQDYAYNDYYYQGQTMSCDNLYGTTFDCTISMSGNPS